MKTLLRSVMIADPTDSIEAHLENFRLFDASGLDFHEVEDVAIWQFIKTFTLQHHHTPDISTIQSHFERTNEHSTSDRLHVIRSIKPRIRGDFLLHLEAKAEDRRKVLVSKLLQEASEIVTRGITIEGKKKGEKKILQGPIDAMRYMLDGAHAVVTPTSGARLSGDVVHDGDDFIAQYDRVKADPLAGVGQFVGLRQMDDALGGAKKFELWTHAAFTGGMKCLTADTRIWDTKTGKLRTVGDIYTTGDYPIVHALDESTGKMVQASVTAAIENGVRPIIRIISEKGRNIRVSSNHPFLTPVGWVEAGTLRPGDWVATPSHLPNTVTSQFTDAQVALTGYMLGDGCFKNVLSFSNNNPKIIQHVVDCLQSCGYQQRTKGPKRDTSGLTYNLYPEDTLNTIQISRSNRQKHRSPLRHFADRMGLWGCAAASKFIPPELWSISDRQVWLLLSALWSTDGHVSVEHSRTNRKARAKCWISFISERLCVDVQALLQRVGVTSTVTHGVRDCNGKPYDFWTTQITTSDSIVKFLTETKIIGKETEALAALSVCESHKGNWIPSEFLLELPETTRAKSKSGGWLYVRHIRNREKVQHDTFKRLADASGCAQALHVANSEIVWERVKSVASDGSEMVYDIEVPGPANFVANGFITHNSSLMLNWAYTQAVYYRHSVLIFSLEMPYGQCRNLLYAMHSTHEKFEKVHPPLDYQAVKEGRLTPKEEWFLKEHVVPDLNQKDKYGSILIEVADPDKVDFSVADIRARAETLYAKTPFNLLFIDHALLVAPRHWVSNTTDRLNEVIRDCKRMAMSFNKGAGMAVVILFQISREGYKAAVKARGLDQSGNSDRKGAKPKAPSNYVYNLSHLSYANECERSSDIVTASWLDDDLSKEGKLLIQCLKSRDQKPFDPFMSSIFWKCRRLTTLDDPSMQDVSIAAEFADLDDLDKFI